ncbi:MAG TPA: HYR domain-containing protein, partial [Anaerolineales bacterium]|nr:HYR domain-containing protein [Anaerolineales bacterium]
NIDKTAPTLNLPSNITVEATSLAGAVVNYIASVSDNLDPAPSISCLPTSGNTFVIGTTMVNCSANDHADNTAFGNFNITVQDSAAPIIAFHADVTAEATSASGANVSYTSPSTSDAVDGSGTATCSPASGSLFALGDTTITCSATDSNGNAAIPTTFVIHVVDTTAPVIAAHADITVEATSASGAVVTYTNPTTTDAVDGAGTSFCSPSSGETFSLGNTTVTCTAADSHGNVSTPATFVVHVVDTTAPLIASHADVTVEATSSAGAAVTYASPTTSDIVDGAGTATCSPASGTTFAIGNTTVTCNATDSNGNAAVATTFVVHVVDTTAPVINPHADVFVPATSALGAIVNYSTPTTTDAVDGAGVANCTPASGSQFAIGNTTVTCNATDSHGNAAVPTSFVVHVVDTAAPVIDGHLDVTVEATSAAGAIATYTSPTTSDVVDGPGVATCSPGSGTFFVFGDTTVTCTATDSNGNAATPTTFIVHVVDTTAPSIASHADVTAEATSASGASVTYTNPTTSDIVDGTGVASCSPASGSTFALGNTTVTCTATDSHGNSASSTSFVVHVVDSTAPVISAQADISVFIDNLIGTIVSYSAPTTSDAVDGPGTASCSPFSGTFFSLGDTLITCNASDSQGNAAQPVTFTVHVVYQPGAPAPTTETTRNPQSGLSIPVTSGLLDLDCLTVINSFGVQVTFHNLCDYQAAVTEAPADTLPAPLPEEYSFVQGLNVLVLFEEEVVKALPTGTGVQLDFSIPADTQDEYDVLLWDDKDGDGIGEWLKVTRLVLDRDLSKVMLADPSDELYQIARTETLDAFYRIITTEKTGTFILVKN